MKTTHTILENFEINYPLERILAPTQALFLDIETTGFSTKTSQLYLIGCAYFSEKNWHIIQWFAEKSNEELQIITEFFTFAKKYKHIVHFNESSLDLTFFEHKCQHYNLPYSFDSFETLDICKRVAPYKYFLKLPDCKQKTIEEFLHIEREYLYDGGELIGMYHDNLKHPNQYIENLLLQNNSDSIRGIMELLPILSYYDLFNGQVKARKIEINNYKDWEGVKRQEVIITLSFQVSLPHKIAIGANNCYFRGIGAEGQLKIRIFEEELKLFYTNYKDYYYLPAEDRAILKSEAGSIDKEHRKNATSATCYIRKNSMYLPQWDYVVSPFYKREYKSNDLFFELTDEIKKNRDVFTMYANHVLQMLFDRY